MGSYCGTQDAVIFLPPQPVCCEVLPASACHDALLSECPDALPTSAGSSFIAKQLASDPSFDYPGDGVRGERRQGSRESMETQNHGRWDGMIGNRGNMK